jgi:hypothetical protein
MEKPLIYHHCRSLEGVEFGTVKTDKERTWEELRPAYQWLVDQSDSSEAWPLFVAVGETEDPEIAVGTGYAWQFQRKKKGEFKNQVLFSFDENDVDGMFSDYLNFDMALNAGDPVQLNRNQVKCILKPSWNKAKWIRKAIKRENIVQLITPELHLPDAKRVWVRNKTTKKLLENMGFTRVEVKRLLVPQL